jgi:hypothetical protein
MLGFLQPREKVAVGCFGDLLVGITGDIHLLRLKEEALDLMFYIVSLIRLETATLLNDRFAPKVFHLSSYRVIS